MHTIAGTPMQDSTWMSMHIDALKDIEVVDELGKKHNPINESVATTLVFDEIQTNRRMNVKFMEYILKSQQVREEISKQTKPIFKKIEEGIDELGQELIQLRKENKELKVENQALKSALNITTTEEPLLLTPEMECKR